MTEAAAAPNRSPAPPPASKLDRLLFAGGGTGGHVFMAVAIRDHLTTRRSTPPAVLFVGTADGLEARILPELHFPLETIRIGGLQRVGLRRQLASLARLPLALARSAVILRRFRPRVVVGLGGYSSGPVVAAARLLRIPCVLIEPNAVPGMTNRWLARFCNGAAVAFETTARWFSGDVRVTGIPIREEFHRIPDGAPFGPLVRLLIFGGSRGSRPINRLVVQALPSLRSLPLSILHQTGAEDFPWVREGYAEHPIAAEVREFIADMPRRFQEADLILSRAGASTIAEITAAGRPAVLIPFPQAADDHQRKNAEALARAGAAVVLDQPSTRPEDLARTLEALVANRTALEAMGRAARSLARPRGAAEIARLLEDVAEEAA